MRDWRWSIILLALQYLGMFVLTLQHWPLSMASVKVVAGWMSAAILGMTRAASKADLVAAGLEAVAFQTRDLLTAMRQDMAVSSIPAASALRVDGGMTANAWLMQRLADILGQRIEVALNPETTALGAAYHAGQQAGFFGDMAELERAWAPAGAFEPGMSETEREARYGGWLEAVARVRSDGA